MYHEAWRIERDWFYDRNIHGLDLKAAEKKYEPYLRNVASRNDLTYLFQEMLGNMTVSHMGTGGGDLPEVKRVQTGLAGRRLRSRQRPLSLRARLQRRELEPAAARAAHAAGREREGGRVSAGGQRPRGAAAGQRLQLLRGTGRQIRGAARGPGCERRGCARSDRGSRGRTRAACATSPGSRRTAAKWTR